jgi:hypothetical protein
MAITLGTLARLMPKAFGTDFEFEIEEDANLVHFEVGGFTQYTDSEGDPSCRVVIEISDDGQGIEFQIRNAYDISDCPHVEAVCRMLLGVCFHTTLVQYAIDERDGEVRLSAELVLVDATITAKQLRRIVDLLMVSLNAFHPNVQRAIEDGIVSYPAEISGESILPEPRSIEGSEGVSALPVDTAELISGLLAARLEAGRKQWSALNPDDTAPSNPKK